MAKYKVLFTVKDNFGNLKEVEGGTIDLDVGLSDLSQEEIDNLGKDLPFVTHEQLEQHTIDLDQTYATDAEVADALAAAKAVALHYSDF